MLNYMLKRKHNLHNIPKTDALSKTSHLIAKKTETPALPHLPL